MIITLVRHTAPDVPAGVCYGQSDVPLKESFETEAAHVAEALKGHCFDRVFTSPLTRCVRLASYCGYAHAQRDERLMEMNFGDWEMQRYDSITDPGLQVYYHDWLHTPATGGESFEKVYRRVSAFLDELRKEPCTNVLLFTHGGVISCAKLYAGRATIETLFDNPLPYGAVLTLEI